MVPGVMPDTVDTGPEQTAEAWDEVAHGWTRHIEEDLIPYTEEALRLVPVGEGDRVLDVACGPGALCLRAAWRGARVLGVDFSKEQIEMLHARAQEEGLDHMEGRVMDGQNLDLEDASFDAAFSMFGLMFFPDRARGFEEIHRVLKPRGQAAVSAWADPSTNDWFTLFGDAIDAALPDIEPSPPPSFMEIADPARLEQEMMEAGFEAVEIHTPSTETTIESAQAGWRKLAEANPVLPGMLSRLGEDAFESIRTAFHELYEARYGEGAATFTDQAHIAVGARG